MNSRCRIVLSVCCAVLMAGPAIARGEKIAVANHLKILRSVGAKGEGHREAIAAAKALSAADIEQLPELLAGMDGAEELATNWIRGVVEAVAQRGQQNGGKLPQRRLEQFLADTRHHPRGRRLAYELIARVDNTAEKRLIPPLLNDPSPELRRDAVALALADADAILKKDQKQAARLAYRKALTAARDVDQIDQATKALRDLGEEVDLPSHFGFVMRWKLVAPFDNTAAQGFDVAYPPEEKVDLDAAYEGKEGEIRWVSHTTKDEFGTVDLNAALANFKGAICYACAEFVSDQERDAQLRLACINANKIWLNGKLLTRNNVYHANMFIDQYKAEGRLKKGKNTILLKIAQNEQTENWAQRWQFQLRVCDQYGTAILSQDRPLGQVALLNARGR